ncbi:MAG: NUMOD4 domain-containing protein [Lentimicrobium sp.]|jgi:hypothetical protein|nr:NUMOD4 domain-containing protein [Lentimicrobium sp.]
METEIWKDIVGYEGLYQVSTHGRIRSSYRTGGYRYRYLSISKTSRYPKVILAKNKKHTHFSVHRLVAIAFIKNHKKLPCVNHINEIKTDNRAVNLEWCTHQQNTNHGNNRKKISDWHKKNSPLKGKSGFLSKSSKPVIQLSENETTLNIFGSAREAGRYLGDYRKSGHITQVCRGERPVAYGYKWKYAV